MHIKADYKLEPSKLIKVEETVFGCSNFSAYLCPCSSPEGDKQPGFQQLLILLTRQSRGWKVNAVLPKFTDNKK